MTSSDGDAVPLPPEMSDAAALDPLVHYTRLQKRTPAARISRGGPELFWASISQDETEFLKTKLASNLEVCLRLLKLADFLQASDVVTLVAGYVANEYFSGKTTQEMCAMLGVPSTAESLSQRFSEETIIRMKEEKLWIQKN